MEGSQDPQKGIEDKVGDARPENTQESEDQVKKYQDPQSDHYQVEKENKSGRKNLHKTTWDNNYLAIDID